MLDLTVVVPAYNESLRIEPTLLDLIGYFNQRGLKYEIIIVNDGSTDNTREVIGRLSTANSQIKLINFDSNEGKGAAVKKGMLTGEGNYILFADADGATPIEEFNRLEKALIAGADIAIGSRALPSSETHVTSRTDRICLGRMFNFFVNLIIVPGIFDTQCGFKLFTKSAARQIFEKQTLKGFSFDVEILYIARKLGLNVKEVAINWNNVPGSKVNVVLDGLRMLRDILIVRIRHRKL